MYIFLDCQNSLVVKSDRDSWTFHKSKKVFTYNSPEEHYRHTSPITKEKRFPLKKIFRNLTCLDSFLLVKTEEKDIDKDSGGEKRD